MDYREVDNKLESLMSEIVTDIQVIHDGGVVTKLKNDDSIILGGSDLAIDMSKKSLELSELLRLIEQEEM